MSSSEDNPATPDPPRSRVGGQPTAPSTPSATSASRLDLSLQGPLPCVVCGYDLQGLSIRGACPECGTLVRATILYRVDPRAEEFAPLYSARLVGAGLVAWIGGALLIVATGWARRIGEWFDGLSLSRDPREWLGTIAILGGIVSMIGAMSLIRPSRETHRGKSVAAAIGTLAYLPMLWALNRLGTLNAQAPFALFDTPIAPDREVARLVLAGSIIIACLGLRAIARDMARRSLALRTGRVDRQTLLAIALAAALGALGDAIRIWASLNRPMLGPNATITAANSVGGALLLVASLFLTLGILGALIDALRVARTLWKPGPTFRQLIGE